MRSLTDIAAEVLSHSETPARIHRKLTQYFTAGVKVVTGATARLLSGL